MRQNQEDFDNYYIEDDEDDVKRYTLWTIVPQLMFLPGSGLEKLKNNAPPPDIAALRFLLPISLAAGASDFFTLFYPNQLTFASQLVSAVISFCAFFLGYYLAVVVAKIFMPKEAKSFPGSDYGKLLTMAGIGSLAFFHILGKLLPMFDFIFAFLPIWTIFIIYEGMKDIVISKEKSTIAIGGMCVVVICAPMLIEWILTLFI